MSKYQYDSKELEFLETCCVPFAIYQYVDRRVVALALSQGFCELFGYEDRDKAYNLMNNNMYRDTYPEDVAHIADAAVRFATEGESYNVIYRSRIDGAYHIIHAVGEHIFKETGDRLAVVWYMDEGIFSEANESLFVNAQNTLRENAVNFKGNYDKLTGLPSMNYFLMLAEAGRDIILKKGGTPILLFFDFNGMKNYNLKYGYIEGDKLIKGMADILRNHFSSESCCRIFADHFVAFMDEKGHEEELEAIFDECSRLNDGQSIPIRVGIHRYSNGEVGCGIACDRAKLACDTNRDSTESTYTYFNEEMLKYVERRQYIISNFDKALKEKWIQVYYQPIVRATNGRVCDEEALARWIDPVVGFMSPVDFIPILEDTKLIYKLDLYVLEQVLEKISQMQKIGLYVVPHSLNISRSDFEKCDIVEEIRKRVDDAGVDHSKITIEITESAIASDIEYIKKQVERFGKLGFKVWMDDYGSGYSSPNVLQKIHFDTIKFDMEFLSLFEKEENTKIILSGLIKLAVRLGIETVVEGVETKEQADFLKEVGCSKLQGYYYCKPIPLDKIIERYDKGEQIGFENPDETEYFTAVGKVNMYDLSLTAEDDKQFEDYYNIMPMTILELKNDEFSVVRCNRSYIEFFNKAFPSRSVEGTIKITEDETRADYRFFKALEQCGEDGNQVIIDLKTSNGKMIHLLIRRVAIDPVTSAKALVVVVIGITDYVTY